MDRGTTPTHTFTLPFDTGLISRVRICYAQMERVVLVKTGEDVKMSGNKIETTLSQEETLGFDCTYPVEIQVRVLLHSGEIHNSEIKTVPVKRCLDNEVMA